MAVAPWSTLVTSVLFACVHNAGRSQMAAALFNVYADPRKAHAISAGTEPGPRVHPEVLGIMREVAVHLDHVHPRKLTLDLASSVDLLITMGCGEACPVVPGARRDDWPLADPKGRPIDEVRRIRDNIFARVLALIDHEGWSRKKPRGTGRHRIVTSGAGHRGGT